MLFDLQQPTISASLSYIDISQEIKNYKQKQEIVKT